MKVRYSVHRKAAMVGQVEDVDRDWAARLIAAGHASAVDGPARAAVSRLGVDRVAAAAVPVASPARPAGES